MSKLLGHPSPVRPHRFIITTIRATWIRKTALPQVGHHSRNSLNAIKYGWIVILCCIHALTYRPSHQVVGRIWADQVGWVRFLAKPTVVFAGLEDDRHSIVEGRDYFVWFCRQDRERADHSPELGSFQFSQRPANAKSSRFRLAIAHGCFVLPLPFHS